MPRQTMSSVVELPAWGRPAARAASPYVHDTEMDSFERLFQEPTFKIRGYQAAIWSEVAPP